MSLSKFSSSEKASSVGFCHQSNSSEFLQQHLQVFVAVGVLLVSPMMSTVHTNAS